MYNGVMSSTRELQSNIEDFLLLTNNAGSKYALNSSIKKNGKSLVVNILYVIE